MKKLLLLFVVVVLLAGLGLAVELFAPRLVADAIEDHVRDQTEEGVGVSAEVGKFPVVTRLLVTGRVPRVSVTLDEVAGQELTFASVRLQLRGVELAREALIGGDVRVRGMRSGQATAMLDANALSQALGVPVRIEDERVLVEAAGTEVAVPLDFAGDTLTLPAGLPAVTLPDLLSCGEVSATVRPNRIRLTCTLDGVPPILT